jgi:hypothetical protein
MKRIVSIALFLAALSAGGLVHAQQSIPLPLPTTSANTIGKTVTMKVGTLTSTATTADQVVVTYTVTAGKTLFLQYFDVAARLTTYAATATNFGDCSLESPAGTKLWTQMVTSTGQSLPIGQQFSEPQPFAGGTVIRLVCTPSAATSFLWRANVGGFER